MWVKYCNKMHPVIVTNKGESQTWKSMMLVREDMEHEIWWQVKTGHSSFWFDNWTKMGALYFVEGSPIIGEQAEVKDFVTNGD